MGYYRAVSLSGSIDPYVIRDTMHTMDKFETFAFPLQFGTDGQNKFPQLFPIQFYNGEGRILTAENFIYPADWVGAGI